MANEQANVQLVNQELYTQGLKKALQGCKEKSTNNIQILDDGQGKVFTSLALVDKAV